MYRRDPSQSFDARLEGQGLYAAGLSSRKPTPVEGDSPTAGTVDGPLAPEPLPRGVDDGESEMRPAGDDPRKADGVEEFKRMEANAEDGRE